jgi:hypothetical protein
MPPSGRQWRPEDDIRIHKHRRPEGVECIRPVQNRDRRRAVVNIATKVTRSWKAVEFNCWGDYERLKSEITQLKEKLRQKSHTHTHTHTHTHHSNGLSLTFRTDAKKTAQHTTKRGLLALQDGKRQVSRNVGKHQSTPRNKSEERRRHLRRVGSLRLGEEKINFDNILPLIPNVISNTQLRTETSCKFCVALNRATYAVNLIPLKLTFLRPVRVCWGQKDKTWSLRSVVQHAATCSLR